MDTINADDIFTNGVESNELKLIRVVGVGGAGGNVVNNMAEQNIEGVSLIACNTDFQALDNSKALIKVKLGENMKDAGLGAGNKPEKGEACARESIEEVRKVLDGAKIVFVTAGMGGGTGTGAAPVIAEAAKQMGILTIGVVSIPYVYEGIPRITSAINGIKRMQESVDSLLVINSERLTKLYSNLKLSESLKQADNVLATATIGISEIINKYAVVNIDLADVRTAMTDSGTSILGTGIAAGEDRAARVLEQALNSPLLNFNDIRGARHVLVNIRSSSDHEVSQGETTFILGRINQLCNNSNNTNVMWGSGIDDSLGEQLSLTLVATGFPKSAALDSDGKKESVKIKIKDDGTLEVVEVEDVAQSVELAPYSTSNDDDIQRIYGEPNKPVILSTKNLSDCCPVPLDKLLEEETITRFEDVPAYQRRSNG